MGPCLWAAIYLRRQGRRDSCSGARDKDLGLWKKGNIAKEAYMAEQVHVRSRGPMGSYGRGGLARVVAVVEGRL